MKIRLEENSIRLRLKQKEVEDFYTNGIVSTTTRFGILPENFIRFSLIRKETIERTEILYQPNELSVLVPVQKANHWAKTDEEGFQAFIPIEENNSLHIIVEKDFRCLHKSPDWKENKDSFPHPLEKGKRC